MRAQKARMPKASPTLVFEQFERAYGEPVTIAALKTKPQDFVVEEVLGFELSGEGEHLWLWIEKVGQNTDWLVKQLAKGLNLPTAAIGYAGKKDRQAVTRQWISVQLPTSRESSLMARLNTLPGVNCLKAQRHSKKCKVGDHLANRFQLVLRFPSPLTAALQSQLNHRLQQLAQRGFPNYFGEQRFGHKMQNLQQGEQFLQNPRRKVPRHLKGLYLSALRSALFNVALSHRIALGNWQTPLDGEVFTEGAATETSENTSFALTGPLPGDGELGSEQAVLALEEAALAPFESWRQGLKQARLTPERRALTCLPQALSWQFETEQKLTLQFVLPKGSYATMLVRELIQVLIRF